MTSLQESDVKCWICGKFCVLENCKIDEHGHAVHEDCHVAKLALKGGSIPPFRPEA